VLDAATAVDDDAKYGFVLEDQGGVGLHATEVSSTTVIGKGGQGIKDRTVETI